MTMTRGDYVMENAAILDSFNEGNKDAIITALLRANAFKREYTVFFNQKEGRFYYEEYIHNYPLNLEPYETHVCIIPSWDLEDEVNIHEDDLMDQRIKESTQKYDAGHYSDRLALAHKVIVKQLLGEITV